MEYRIISKKGISYIIIPELSKLGLKHCFTTIDMDMRLSDEDSIENIVADIEEIYDLLDIDPQILYTGFQTHSKNVEKIISLDQGKDNHLGRSIPDTDGLITDMEDVVLLSKYADCSPILIFDPIKRVQGNIHSGWKGTLQEIGAVAVDKIVKNYDSNPENIIAIIGPTIGKDDFEVHMDVKMKFKEKFDFHKDIIKKKNHIKYTIDLQETNKRILMNKGIPEKNITTIDLSTYSTDILHSYRRDRENYGLMGLITIIPTR